MPPATKAFDALWHCLTPSSSSPVRKYLHLAPKRSPRLSIQYFYFQLGNHISRTAIQPRAVGHNARTIHTAISRRAQQEVRLSAEEFRDQGIKRKLDEDDYHNLRQLSLEGSLPRTQRFVKYLVKDLGEEPNVRIYNAMLLANADHEHGSASEAASILEEMVTERITPDAATYHAALRVLAVHPDYLLRNHVCQELRQRWFSLTKDGWHDLVIGLIRDRQIEIALDVLEQIRREGIKIEAWLLDVMIYALCSVEEFDAALNLMEQRVSDGDIRISATVWYCFLDTASRAFHHSATLFAFRARVETFYLNPSAGMCINILSTAARHADTYLATSILRILGRRSGNPIQLHHYEALLETYIAADDIRTALTLLTIMSAAGQAPIEASTRPVYTYLCQSPTLPAKAISILTDLHEEDRKIPVQAANVVLQARIFHRDLPAALSLYKNLHRLGHDLGPDTATFNILFRGCAQAVRKDLAMFLASEMVALKITPDALTYDRLILVCLNSEDSIEDAWRYFEEINALGWWPRDGTSLVLAKRACEQSDRRIWKLERISDGKGIPTLRLQELIRNHWQGGAEEAQKELNRGR